MKGWKIATISPKIKTMNKVKLQRTDLKRIRESMHDNSEIDFCVRHTVCRFANVAQTLGLPFPFDYETDFLTGVSYDDMRAWSESSTEKEELQKLHAKERNGIIRLSKWCSENIGDYFVKDFLIMLQRLS